MKAYKATVYVLDFEHTEEDEIKHLLTNNKYLHTKLGSLESADIGEWHDDHELNKRGADWEKFFKKINE